MVILAILDHFFLSILTVLATTTPHLKINFLLKLALVWSNKYWCIISARNEILIGSSLNAKGLCFAQKYIQKVPECS